MVLKDLEARNQNQKKEVNCIIVEDAELKILVKIIRKYTRFFRKKSKTFHYKAEERKRSNKARKNSQPSIEGILTGLSIKERIKIFSGEFIKKQEENKIIPGRLKIPEVFIQGEKEAKSQKKEEKDKDKQKK
jgi:hypothetical protein